MPPRSRSRAYAAVRRRPPARVLTWTGALALTALLLPATASAGFVTDGVGDILKEFYLPISKETIEPFFDALVHTDNLQNGEISALADRMSATALGALGAVLTISVFRYWVGSLSPSGRSEGVTAGLEGLGRGVGAILFIVIWPWLFTQLVALSNALSTSLTSTKQANVAYLSVAGLGAILAASSIAIFPLVLLAAVSIMILGLVMMKAVLTALLAVCYVGLFFFAVFFAIPELAWLPQKIMRGIATILTVPVAWALTLAVFGAMNLNFFKTFGELPTAEDGRLISDQLMLPLVCLALFVILLKEPKLLMRAGMQGVASVAGAQATAPPGFIGRTASHIVGQSISNAIAARVPQSFGGRLAPAVERGSGYNPATGETVPWERKRRLSPEDFQKATEDAKAYRAKEDAKLAVGTDKVTGEKSVRGTQRVDPDSDVATTAIAEAKKQAKAKAEQVAVQQDLGSDQTRVTQTTHMSKEDARSAGHIGAAQAHFDETTAKRDEERGWKEQAHEQSLARHDAWKDDRAAKQAANAAQAAQAARAWSAPLDSGGTPFKSLAGETRADLELRVARLDKNPPMSINAALGGMSSPGVGQLRELRAAHPEQGAFHSALANTLAGDLSPGDRAGMRVALRTAPEIVDYGLEDAADLETSRSS